MTTRRKNSLTKMFGWMKNSPLIRKVVAFALSRKRGGPSAALAVEHQGGQDLDDRYGPLPVDSDNYILDPYTGERLQVENGWEDTDTVGDHEPYLGAIGRSDGSIRIGSGAPASQRRQGLDQLDFTNYLQVTLSEDAHSFIAQATMTGSPTLENPVFGIDASDYRWGIQVVGPNEISNRIFDNTVVRATATITGASAFASGVTFTAGGGADSDGDVSLAAWDDTGTEVNTPDTDNFAGTVTSLAGEYTIGRGRGGGDFVNGTINVWGGFDGDHYDSATLSTMEASIRAGMDVDTLAGTYGGAWSDGITPGAYSRIATEKLFSLSGAGSKPVVARPGTSGETYTQPQDIDGLIGDWDCLRGATYTGTTLTGCYDYGPNEWDLTHGSTVGQRTVEMLGRNVFLPGTGGGTYLERAITTTIEDFTVTCSIPIRSYSSTGRSYFSMNVAAIATWGLQIQQGPSVGTMAILDDSGTTVATIPHGARTSGNGDAAHAILVFRRTAGGDVVVDCWYDQDAGGGLVRSTQVVASDTFSASIDVTGVAVGGRYGTSVGSWNSFSGVHRVTMHDSAISDDDMIAVVKGHAARLGWDTDLIKPLVLPAKAARYVGGKTLEDSVGELPKDADGYYLTRNGLSYLTVDDGFDIGDVVGEPKLYGLLTAQVIGNPATQRRSGFDNNDDLNYALVTLDTSDISFLVSANRATNTYDAIFDSTTADPRVQLSTGPGGIATLRMRTTDGGVTEFADTAGIVPPGQNFFGGTLDGSTGDMLSKVWDSSGAPLGTGSHTGTVAVDISGPLYLGRQFNNAYAWDSGIFWAMGWDGTVMSEADLDAIVAAMQAGADIDDIRTTYGVTLATDGIVCGAYDPDNPTVLFTEAGAGESVRLHNTAPALPAVAARYIGGKTLNDSIGELFKDDDGYYQSRLTGEYLTLDDGFGSGDAIGPEYMYGLKTAVVENNGTPIARGGLRRNGFTFDSSGSQYIGFNLTSEEAHSFLVYLEGDPSVTSPSTQFVFGFDATAPLGAGWQGLLSNLEPNLRTYNAATTEDVAARVLISQPVTANDLQWIGGFHDGTDTELSCWDDVGAQLGVTGTSTRSVPVTLTAQPYFLGGRPGGGVPLQYAEVLEVYGWDGGAGKTFSELQAVIDASIAGGEPSANAPGADLASDGIICGAYDPLDTTILFTESGAGESVRAHVTAPVVPALVARYNGGKTLTDATGELPKDENDYYKSRLTNEYLSVDTGFADTDVVGEPKVYGLLTATVHGAPATARRSGFDACTDADYIEILLSDSDYGSALALTRQTSTPAVPQGFLFGAGTDPRWGMLYTSGDYRTQTVNSGVLQTDIAGALSTTAADRFIAATVDNASGTLTQTAHAWDETGTPLAGSPDQDTSGAHGGDLSGVYYLGRTKSTGYAYTSGTVRIALGWDGATLSDAQLQSVVDDILAGEDIDTVASNAAVMPALATDGLVCGVYDPYDTALLYTLGASGADVTLTTP